jgi:S1-C subfamily serine protease
VAYGVGIERQARQWFDGGIASVIPVPVIDSEGQPIKAVQASYANFVWGIEAEDDTQFPTLGVSTKAADGSDSLRQVLQIDAGSAASRAGIAVGDVIVSFDGHDVRGREILNRLVAGKAWGDSATIVVRRGDEEKTLTAYFRRTPPWASESAAR